MATYPSGHHEAVLRSHSTRNATNSCAYLLPHLKSTDRLLDIGCGPGTISVDLATRVQEVVGVEPAIAADVLEKAKQYARDENVNNVTFVVGDIHKLPFDDDSFDVVHCHQVLQHAGDPVGALREMRRITKPGGIVAAREADMGSAVWFTSNSSIDEQLARFHRTWREVARGNGGDPHAGRQLLAWAHQAGFRDVTPSGSSWTFAGETGTAWWSRIMADRAEQSSYRDGLIKLGMSDQEISLMADSYRQWAKDPDAWFSLVHGEILARKS